MSQIPETRQSLLLRAKDAADRDAWRQFEAIYRPAVYRYARRRGLQHADADDLAQQVFVAVAQTIEDWDVDSSRGSFRAWLLKVSRNAVINTLSRKRPDVGVGGTSMLQRIAGQADPSKTDPLDWEYRRAVFQWAAAEVRGEFQAATWSAFWMTTVEGASIEDAAGALGKSVGAVYAARSRVMRRLKRKVQELQSESLEADQP